MAVNTVTIDLDTYHTLKRAEENVKKHTVIIGHQSNYSTYKVNTDDEDVKILAEELKEMTSKVKDLKDCCDTIKNMTSREFRAWKKEYKSKK